MCHFNGLNYSSPTSIVSQPENDFLKTPWASSLPSIPHTHNTLLLILIWGWGAKIGEKIKKILILMFSWVRKQYLRSPGRNKRQFPIRIFCDQCPGMLSIVISLQITLANIPASASHFPALTHPGISSPTQWAPAWCHVPLSGSLTSLCITSPNTDVPLLSLPPPSHLFVCSPTHPPILSLHKTH